MLVGENCCKSLSIVKMQQKSEESFWQTGRISKILITFEFKIRQFFIWIIRKCDKS